MFLNKKQLFLVALATFLVAFSFVLFYKIDSYNKRLNHKKELPDQAFRTLDNKQFNFSEIPEKNRTLIIYFSPDCEFCTKEIDDILKHYSLSKHTTIILVSPVMKAMLYKFQRILSLEHYKDIILLHDDDDKFHTLYGTSSIPTTILYDSKRNMIVKLEGGRPAKLILKKFNVAEGHD